MTSSASTSAASKPRTPRIFNEQDLREAARAKWWRKNIARLTIAQLCALSGYSKNSINMFERGYRYDGKPITPAAWRRYRAVCGGLSNTRWAATPWQSYIERLTAAKE